MVKRIGVFQATLFFLFFSSGSAMAGGLTSFNGRLESQYQTSIQWLTLNLSPSGSIPGSIVAAPSRVHPDYYFHWVRDAALTAASLVELYPKTKGPLRANLKSFFLDHIQFNLLMNQGLGDDRHLGEPKFNMDASVYMGPWGRPQNDGPALRSSTFIEMLSLMEREAWPEGNFLSPLMYDGVLPSKSLIKRDLEYTAHRWSDFCFDLWEEVHGWHFYTLMSQRKSLQAGSALARTRLDRGAADFYEKQVALIDSQLERFWSAGQGHILATLFPQVSLVQNISAQNRFKSQLDSAVILAVLHSELAEGSFSVSDDRVLATYEKLRESFAQVYSINKSENSNLGIAFGRYPEDTYDGYETQSLGNPWVLTTAGAAEFLYRLIARLQEQGTISVSSTNIRFYQEVSGIRDFRVGKKGALGASQFRGILKGLFAEADSLMERVLYHSNPDGSLSEQINRQNGYMQGAPNLTWSHASFITAKLWRDRVQGFFK